MKDKGIFLRGFAIATGACFSVLTLHAKAGGLMLWEIGTPTLGTAGAGMGGHP